MYISRPLVPLQIYSERYNTWFSFKNVLADTGADISLLPKSIGEILIQNIHKGIPKRIKGIVPSTFIHGHIHYVKYKIENKIFNAPVFITQIDDVNPILGRTDALDQFDACFEKGQALTLKV